MPETSTTRRKLRALTAIHTRRGHPVEAGAARSALAVQTAAEQVAALRALDPAPSPEQCERLAVVADALRTWAAEQAAVAPPIAPEVAARIAAALRGAA